MTSKSQAVATLIACEDGISALDAVGGPVNMDPVRWERVKDTARWARSVLVPPAPELGFLPIALPALFALAMTAVAGLSYLITGAVSATSKVVAKTGQELEKKVPAGVGVGFDAVKWGVYAALGIGIYALAKKVR